MKLECSFFIENKPIRGFDFSCRVPDKDDFEAVANHCRAVGLIPNGSSSELLRIAGLEDDPRILVLLGKLSELGKYGVWSFTPDFEVDGRHFAIRRFRKIAARDLGASEFLTAFGWGRDIMCRGRIIGGEFHYSPEDFRPKVMLGFCPSFGSEFLVQDPVKVAIEREGMVGLRFREVFGHVSLPKGRRVWALTSNFVVEGCLSKYFSSMDRQGAEEYMIWEYDDNAIFPRQLEFSKRARSNLEGVDFALVSHCRADGLWSPVDSFLFSQRFRHVVDSIGVSKVSWSVVRFRDD